jgi:hypothetical protein
MKEMIKVIALTALFSMFAGAVQSSTIFTTAACIDNSAVQCATGIKQLDVMGTLFDVTFSQLSYNDLFAVNAPYFLGNEAGANAVAAAIAATLHMDVLGMTEQSGEEGSKIFVPFSLGVDAYYGQDMVYSRFARQQDGGLWVPYSSVYSSDASEPLSSLNPWYYNSYAIVTKASAEAPAPATLALFGLGLVSVGISRRQPNRRYHIY